MTGFAPCPGFEPGRSRWLTAAIVVAHLCALAAIAVAAIPPGVQLLLIVALLAAGTRSLRRDAWRVSADAVVRLARRPDGCWMVIRNDGGRWVGTLDDDCHVAAPLVVVAVRDGRRRRFIPVAADALPAAEFRRLRVALRWSAGPLC